MDLFLINKDKHLHEERFIVKYAVKYAERRTGVHIDNKKYPQCR